ncbi:hypothetical protein [Leeuwenhoekiella marinoflava]|uniref:Lipoprotein n=2 Tax=Leeuwenhoekiella marinoflava TaxID=988 RepID=A0A4Q0PPZ8_9FLAO|nr:hypothetical protein [Leeuwenhoekiella marinoflava]RXG32282.1 hypothetical protein DSL99_1088 [Leeuwenhoekiella marinoflava]SHE80634.1 hypothetical protein SAMN02745246_01071 [Leeuwenhoekiella marinoflava DSM 3653]
MKRMSYIAILIILIAILMLGCGRLFGGMSKDRAAVTLEQYLTERFQKKLSFENLNRFFNEGNMNPNMFSVEIFDQQYPKIRFALHFDAKKMKEEDLLDQGGYQERSLKEMYTEAKTDYTIKQNITEQLENKGILTNFEYYSVNLNFTTTPSSLFIKNTISELLNTMNQNRDTLYCGGYFKFNIKTPVLSHSLLQGETIPGIEGWDFTHFTINTKAEAYTKLQSKINLDIIAYLKQSQASYRLHPTSKTYVNADTFDEAVWIQFLSDQNGSRSKEPVAWKEPITAVMLVFFDLETQKMLRTELHTIVDLKTFEERWEKIEELLPFTTTL